MGCAEMVIAILLEVLDSVFCLCWVGITSENVAQVDTRSL